MRLSVTEKVRQSSMVEGAAQINFIVEQPIVIIKHLQMVFQ